VLYLAAFVELRHDTDGRGYHRRKLAAGKTPMEAMRCLKRRLSDVIFRQLVGTCSRHSWPNRSGSAERQQSRHPPRGEGSHA
jgi:transposase